MAFLLMVISWGGSCGCISPETRVGVTHGDAQILDRQCATNTAVRRNTDDNSWDASSIARELRRALDWATAAPEILFRRDDAARELWQDCYPALSQLRQGLRGAATSRAEAQVLRLSAIYAALDNSSVVGLPHLRAALAVWDYCSASASHLFGESTGDAIADRIREALEESPRDYRSIRSVASSTATSAATASTLPSNN
jgi:hypothetical protein